MYGYRVLERVHKEWVSPIYRQTWEFGSKAIAKCNIAEWEHTEFHAVPDSACRCGFYASKDIMAVLPYMRATPSVIAFGWGSGKIIVGETGYRAAEWEPVYAVDLSSLDAQIDEMWDEAERRRLEGKTVEMAIAIFGLDGAKARAHKSLRDNYELMCREGLGVISLAQAQVMLGDSWEK
jgi:hypothetical protein